MLDAIEQCLDGVRVLDAVCELILTHRMIVACYCCTTSVARFTGKLCPCMLMVGKVPIVPPTQARPVNDNFSSLNDIEQLNT